MEAGMLGLTAKIVFQVKSNWEYKKMSSQTQLILAILSIPIGFWKLILAYVTMKNIEKLPDMS